MSRGGRNFPERADAIDRQRQKNERIRKQDIASLDRFNPARGAGGGGGSASLDYFTALGDSAPGDVGPIDSNLIFWTFPNQEHQSGGFTRVPLDGIPGGEAITIPSAGFWVAHLTGQVQVAFGLDFSGLPPFGSYDHSTFLVTPGPGPAINVGGVLEAGDAGDNPSLHPYILIPFYVAPEDVGQVAYFYTGFVAIGPDGSSQELLDVGSGYGMRFALYKIAGGVGVGGGGASPVGAKLACRSVVTTHNSEEIVPFSDVVYDPAGIVSGNTFVAPSEGLYDATFGPVSFVQWGAQGWPNTDGRIAAYIVLNGSEYVADDTFAVGSTDFSAAAKVAYPSRLTATNKVHMQAGDTLDARVFSNFGVDVNCVGGGSSQDDGPGFFFSVAKVA